MIGNWLTGCAAELIPDDLVAFNIGLFEGDGGTVAYLVGARVYDADDSDWACVEDWTPEARYCPVPHAGEWHDVLNAVVADVRAWLRSAAGRTSPLADATAVTVGFDDGDLVVVRSST